jgi:hypothetical protein
MPLAHPIDWRCQQRPAKRRLGCISRPRSRKLWPRHLEREALLGGRATREGVGGGLGGDATRPISQPNRRCAVPATEKLIRVNRYPSAFGELEQLARLAGLVVIAEQKPRRRGGCGGALEVCGAEVNDPRQETITFGAQSPAQVLVTLGKCKSLLVSFDIGKMAWRRAGKCGGSNN